MSHNELSSNMFSLCLPCVGPNVRRDTIWHVFETGVSLGRVVKIDMIPRKNRITCSLDECDSFLVFVHLYWNENNPIAVKTSRIILNGGQVKLHYMSGRFWWVKASSTSPNETLSYQPFVEFIEKKSNENEFPEPLEDEMVELEEGKSTSSVDDRTREELQQSNLEYSSLVHTPIPEVKTFTNQILPLERHLDTYVPTNERINGIYYDMFGMAKGWYNNANTRIVPKAWSQYKESYLTPLEILQQYASAQLTEDRRRASTLWTLRREDSIPDSYIY